MNKENKNLYVKIAEFSDKHPEGFAQIELSEDKNANLSDFEKNILFTLFSAADYNTISIDHTDGSVNPTRETLFIRIGTKEIENASHPIYILNFTSFYNHLSYIELIEARKAAKSARIWSLIALAVSASLAIATILIQIFGYVNIDKKQFERILNNSYEIKHSENLFRCHNYDSIAENQ